MSVLPLMGSGVVKTINILFPPAGGPIGPGFNPPAIIQLGERVLKGATMKKMESGSPLTTAPAYLPPPDAANYLQVSERYLATMRKRRLVPCIRLGRRCVRYAVKDLDAAMLRFRRGAAGEGGAS